MRPSRVAGTARRSAIPITGRKRARLRTRASDMGEAPRERGDDAGEHQEGIELQAAALEAAQHARGALPERGEPMERAVEEAPVAEVQEHAPRDPEERAP